MKFYSLILCLAWFACAPAYAHPFHVSHAQVEFNPKSNSLEVALHIHAIDLERVLHQITGKPVDLDTTKNIDRKIQDYLNKVFLVRVPKQKKYLKLKWVGKETTIKSAWLYFEIPIPKSANTVEVSQQLFFKTVEGQVNFINFRAGKERKSHRFTTSKPKQTLKLRRKPSK